VEQHQLKKAWLDQALAKAGIGKSSWHPEQGVDVNRSVVEAVYTYYGQLFLEHDYLQWAGMAAMVGPAFYAGFRDLGFVPDAIRRAVITVLGRASRTVARRAAGDPGFFEATFLTMQKKIFEDQAPLHEAYLAGGVPLVEEFYRARIIDLATLTAWRQIDGGKRRVDPPAVARGNRTLLFREQHDIINRLYLRMLRYHGPEGAVFTYALTLVGAPPVPGARSYPERFPLQIAARLPGGTVSIRTPLADGNIAMFTDRWNLIDGDTLPRYLEFIREHPAAARAMVQTPIATRMARYRLLRRGPQLSAAAFTHWDVQVGDAQPLARRRAAAAPVRSAAQGEVTVDLTFPPSREEAGFAPGTDSRVWINPRYRPTELAVKLPDGRVYRAQAVMAVMLSSTGNADPGRLTIQLPSRDLDATARLLSEYAATWDFPSDAVDLWRASAESRPPSDQNGSADLFTYGTHVFTPDDVGFVHLEFQVSAHLPEREFVVAALFSW
jgi:hypothetical protein